VDGALISYSRGETVKKIAFMLMAMLLAMAVAGCAATSTTTPHPTDTTPSTMPTQTPPTGTPAPQPFLSGYAEYLNGATQPVLGAEIPPVTCTYEAVYHDSNLTMPHALQTQYGYAHHGAIYRLSFANPTGAEKTIVAGDNIRSFLQYVKQGSRQYVATSDVFYDPATRSEYGELRLAPGQSKEVYMLAYITNDSVYDQYGSLLDPRPSIDLNPHYFEQT
jgi:hypothetical protein